MPCPDIDSRQGQLQHAVGDRVLPGGCDVLVSPTMLWYNRDIKSMGEICMDDLDFRKWLTERGITKEEYDGKNEEEQKGIEKQYKLEHRGKSIQSFGEGMQGCGCAIMGVIILAVIIYFIYLVVAS